MPLDENTVRAIVREEVREQIDRFAGAVIGNISDLRVELNGRLALLERRTERIETSCNATMMQTAGMSKSLTDTERLDSQFRA